jgi:hypothetical protein
MCAGLSTLQGRLVATAARSRAQKEKSAGTAAKSCAAAGASTDRTTVNVAAVEHLHGHSCDYPMPFNSWVYDVRENVAS